MSVEDATEIIDRLEKTTQAIAEKYTAEDGSLLEHPSPGVDALAYANALIPTLKEEAERKWKEAVVFAEKGEWKPLFFLLLNDGQRISNQSLDKSVRIRRKGGSLISLALSLESAYINDPSLW